MDSIFQQLLQAFYERQGGTVHIRNIIAPLTNPETGEKETIDFYAEADANPDDAQHVFAVVANAGLYLPDHPAQATPPPPVPADEQPTETPPPPPVDQNPTETPA